MYLCFDTCLNRVSFYCLFVPLIFVHFLSHLYFYILYRVWLVSLKCQECLLIYTLWFSYILRIMYFKLKQQSHVTNESERETNGRCKLGLSIASSVLMTLHINIHKLHCTNMVSGQIPCRKSTFNIHYTFTIYTFFISLNSF